MRLDPLRLPSYTNLMQRLIIRRWAVIGFLLLQSLMGNVLAAVQGDIERTSFRSSVCNIASMEVSFKIDEAFGEPLITSKMRWQAGPNTNTDCLSPLTNVWLKARTVDNEFRYIKVSPTIPPAGIGFGRTATESPNWSRLLCEAPTENSQCDNASTASTIVNPSLRFESFEVATVASAIENVSTTTRNNSAPAGTDSSSKSNNSNNSSNSNNDFSFESALDDIIDGSIGSNSDNGSVNGSGNGSSNGSNAQTSEPGSVLTDEKTVADGKVDSLTTGQAEGALANIVRIMSTSMSEFVTQSHTCESQRTVGNWVQAKGVCELNFRSETNYDYLCSEDGKSRAVRSTRQFNLDIGSDLKHVSDIRISNEGWLALVLETKSNAHSNSEADYQTNRWQFTTDADKLGDLELLAGSLLTLKQHCESENNENNENNESNIGTEETVSVVDQNLNTVASN